MNDSDIGVTMPPCANCRNVIVNGGCNLSKYTCRAFPRGIPGIILRRITRHDTPDEFFGDLVVYDPVEYRDERGAYIITYDGDRVDAST